MRIAQVFRLHGCDVALVETEAGARRAYYRPQNVWIQIRGYAWKAKSSKLVGQWQWKNATPVWGPDWSLNKGEAWLWQQCLPRAVEEGTELLLHTWLGRRAELRWHNKSCQWLLLDDGAADLPLAAKLQPRAATRRVRRNADE